MKALGACHLALAVYGLSLTISGTPAPVTAARRALCDLFAPPVNRDTATTYFVGTALADTVVAGPGTTKPTGREGHWGSGRPRAVYGQVVRIDTIGGAHVELVRRVTRKRESPEIVVVPWDYDPGCHTTYWSISARWVKPGRTGFYSVRLRPQSHWAGGRPTFDVFIVDMQPFPHGPLVVDENRRSIPARVRSLLTAREMFQLVEALPVSPQRQLDASALEPLERWAREHPALARKFPADHVLETYRRHFRGT